MRYLFMILLLIPGQVQAEPLSPREKELLSSNPYRQETYILLDQKEYDHARRQVAEVCQDLGFAIRTGKIQNEELQSEMDQCNPDDLEWDAFQTCKDNGIPASNCDVTEILLIYAGLLRLPLLDLE